MKLRVTFNCLLKVSEFRKNYSGKITLLPGPRGKTFYFLMLNPHGGKAAEFSIYEDEEKTVPLVEGVGEESLKNNPETGLPITNFDFSIGPDSPTVGLVYVLTNIISEAIYHLDLMYQKKEVDLGAMVDFNHVWEQDFGKESLHIAQSFKRSFGLS